MRAAGWKDRKLVVDILVNTFGDNPAINWLFQWKNNKQRNLTRLANYVFINTLKDNGVLISGNEKGVAIYFQPDSHRTSIVGFLYKLFFSFASIGILHLKKVLKRELARKACRPTSGRYIYFWFLGVLPEGGEAGFELKNALFRESNRLHLPIYLETSVQRNVPVYERIGFTLYHEWHDEIENIHFWFMKREPEISAIQVYKGFPEAGNQLIYQI